MYYGNRIKKISIFLNIHYIVCLSTRHQTFFFLLDFQGVNNADSIQQSKSLKNSCSFEQPVLTTLVKLLCLVKYILKILSVKKSVSLEKGRCCLISLFNLKSVHVYVSDPMLPLGDLVCLLLICTIKIISKIIRDRKKKQGAEVVFLH